MEPVSYASRAADAERQVRPATFVAGGWVLLLLWAAYTAYVDMEAGQGRLVGVINVFLNNLSFEGLRLLAFYSCGPILFSFFVGAGAAAALWHWSRQRLRWILLIPALTGVWNASGPNTQLTIPAGAVLNVGFGSSSIPVPWGNAFNSYGGTALRGISVGAAGGQTLFGAFLVAVIFQCAAVYLGIRAGRALAITITNLILPPAFALTLTQLWQN